MMERFNKYLVVKWSDIEKYLLDDQQMKLHAFLTRIAVGRLKEGKQPQEYVVVAKDWPMYETVWGLIESFVDGIPSEIDNLRAQLAAERAKVAELELENSMINYETVAWYEGHDDAVRGVAQRWREALTEPIPKAGVMNEPLESLYRDTEKLRQQIADLTAQLAAKESAEPDAYCVTSPDGDCISDDPRCMHNRGSISEQEPVAWWNGEYSSCRFAFKRDTAGIGLKNPKAVPLYTTPPAATTLVEDFKRRAVEAVRECPDMVGITGHKDRECVIVAIESLPLIEGAKE